MPGMLSVGWRLSVHWRCAGSVAGLLLLSRVVRVHLLAVRARALACAHLSGPCTCVQGGPGDGAAAAGQGALGQRGAASAAAGPAGLCRCSAGSRTSSSISSATSSKCSATNCASTSSMRGSACAGSSSPAAQPADASRWLRPGGRALGRRPHVHAIWRVERGHYSCRLQQQRERSTGARPFSCDAPAHWA